jgi:hypothetical protein
MPRYPPHIKWSFVLLVSILFGFRNRKVKWSINVSTWQYSKSRSASVIQAFFSLALVNFSLSQRLSDFVRLSQVFRDQFKINFTAPILALLTTGYYKKGRVQVESIGITRRVNISFSLSWFGPRAQNDPQHCVKCMVIILYDNYRTSPSAGSFLLLT